ncbi:streptomycin 3'-adenylyltransferase [Paenibacillus rhizosphaerae]|uniref:Spectinomycin 9-adenylyltransferase n=1 Tax=Paenibacillus rhizosphaerae TaxID=297318 RepID=A0A839TVY1_9BACL|nr:aminoglycoside adenylyltransferase domain-containing protein [Paenibacillus rhizosphaerae]MBB3129409.1 streptomycin 3'-adenylyltransferase [Paenibacillus rhizosphaerae]
MKTQQALDRLTQLFMAELGEPLTGLYLHGSLAMGCYREDRSDIDLLAVIEEKPDSEVWTRLARGLLELHGLMPGHRGMEVSVILRQYAGEPLHPTPFEFHYSEAHRERYESDAQYVCGGYEDPDLAAHMMVIYHRGMTLYGEPARSVFRPEKEMYIRSIWSDVEHAVEQIAETPVYYTLNLCRILRFLREGEVSSKKEGGEWGLSALPPAYESLLRQCLLQYGGQTDKVRVEPRMLQDFARDMLKEIEQRMMEEGIRP